VLILWLWAALIAFSVVVISLYTGVLMWAAIAFGVVFTLAATFLLPTIQRPHLTGHREPQSS
jgi:UDP-GlcNAc:undecaprenyl-phosphate GlcNAc-1-phosphate transferase